MKTKSFRTAQYSIGLFLAIATMTCGLSISLRSSSAVSSAATSGASPSMRSHNGSAGTPARIAAAVVSPPTPAPPGVYFVKIDSTTGAATIARANFDLTGITDLGNLGCTLNGIQYGIAIDAANGQIYIANGGNYSRA